MTAPTPGRFRVAPVFDGDDAGQPYFSPDRWRVMDGVVRAQLAAYLSGAPLALRAYGLELDPLDPGRGPAVPMSYRTDGLWVWQDAAEYYLTSMGAAPPDELVAHIEAAGFRPPTSLPEEVLVAAAQAAASPSPPDGPDGRRGLTYFADVTGQRSTTAPGGLRRSWRQDFPNVVNARVHQACGRTGRWHDTTAPLSPTFDSEHDLAEISPRQAAAVMDRWWTGYHS